MEGSKNRESAVLSAAAAGSGVDQVVFEVLRPQYATFRRTGSTRLISERGPTNGAAKQSAACWSLALPGCDMKLMGGSIMIGS